MFWDSHAHLSSEKFLGCADELVRRARQASVTHIVNICTDEASWKRGEALAFAFPNTVINAAATTPHDVAAEGESFFPLVEEAARLGALKAIGETGLDYFYEHSDRALQQKFLVRYVELARELHLPIIFHCRNAFADLFDIVDRHWPDGRCLLHCFTGTKQEADEVVRRGWKLSLSGILTFKKSLELQEIARALPLDALLIETDSPYLAPQSHRGQVNEPAFVVEVAACLASLKGLSLEVIAETTSRNTAEFFRILQR